MAVYVALLRGINVSGQKKIRMADLRSLFESLGLARITTYVQSGNVVFTAGEPPPDDLPSLIEGEITRVYGFDVTVLVRNRADFLRLSQENPFLAASRSESIDPTKLHVTFLAEAPSAAAAPALAAAKTRGNDRFVLAGREIYLHCPDGYGRTKFSNQFFERKLAVPATTRNWKTVTALSELAAGHG